MARDILSEYGNDANKPQAPRATNGGKMPVRDVHNYQPPQGPKHIMNTGVGLKGGTNYGSCGTQERTSLRPQSSGSPGLHGDNKGHGTNRG